MLRKPRSAISFMRMPLIGVAVHLVYDAGAELGEWPRLLGLHMPCGASESHTLFRSLVRPPPADQTTDVRIAGFMH